MSTIKQKKLAKEIVNNMKRTKPINKGKLVEMVGYSKITAETKPGEIIHQKGVQEELKELGFDEDSAKKVVSEIMNNPKAEPGARLKATDQVFKVLGLYSPKEPVNKFAGWSREQLIDLILSKITNKSIHVVSH
ncbi:MAG: hypothetical protein WCS86_00140 [Candidatus Paceibacterota bacterium]